MQKMSTAKLPCQSTTFVQDATHYQRIVVRRAVECGRLTRGMAMGDKVLPIPMQKNHWASAAMLIGLGESIIVASGIPLYFAEIAPILGIVFGVVGLRTFKTQSQNNRWMAWSGIGLNAARFSDVPLLALHLWCASAVINSSVPISPLTADRDTAGCPINTDRTRPIPVFHQHKTGTLPAIECRLPATQIAPTTWFPIKVSVRRNALLRGWVGWDRVRF